MKRSLGKKVKPLSEKKIVGVAHSIRDQLEIGSSYLKITNLYEVLQEMEELVLEILEDNELEEEALCFPDHKLIQIKESVYNDACDGNGHARFTLAHELGHLFLHQKQESLSYAKGKRASHKIFEDSEWQADVFASELLMDTRMVDINMEAEDAAHEFGLSKLAAQYKLKKLKDK